MPLVFAIARSWWSGVQASYDPSIEAKMFPTNLSSEHMKAILCRQLSSKSFTSVQRRHSTSWFVCNERIV